MAEKSLQNDKDTYFYSMEGALDAHLFHEGTFFRSYEFLGAHPFKNSVRFVVWAPNARLVYVTGDFNGWQSDTLPMRRISDSGLWEICVKTVKEYDNYKYRICTQDGRILYKADPYAFHAEERPNTASKYYDIQNYPWKDQEWINRNNTASYDKPMAIYEVNLLSWKKNSDQSTLSYRQLAKELVAYVKKMGYTHIELMPVMEHPFDGSWGYQTTGYYAPTSRYGTPKDFMYFVEQCHRNEIGVILDWAPVHFCRDDHGLRMFDGTACYESSDPEKANNDQWGTNNFDFSKPEVQSFLISNALYWHDYYHIDGIRIDAVAYMLYLNFSGKEIKNEYGGYENLEAVEFIKKLNKTVFQHYPHTLMMAEESTAWPLVTGPVHEGGLGFNYKWNMGWMNDILEYTELDPIFRKDHHHHLTFSITYAFSENYVLPFSHDEVVHGKKSLLNKMPGTYEEKFAGLRLLFLYQYSHPGKKLLFMGGEFGQFIEWNEWQELDWFLLDYTKHAQIQTYVKELNQFYTKEPALYEQDHCYDGFQWVEHENQEESIIVFERLDKQGESVIVALNFTPVARKNYPIGVKREGSYRTVFHTDKQRYGGSLKRVKTFKSIPKQHHGKPFLVEIELPPLGGLILQYKK